MDGGEQFFLLIKYVIYSMLLYFLYNIYKISKYNECAKTKLINYKYIWLLCLMLLMPLLDIAYYFFLINNKVLPNNLLSIYMLLYINIFVLLIVYTYNDIVYCSEIKRKLPFYRFIKIFSIIILYVVFVLIFASIYILVKNFT